MFPKAVFVVCLAALAEARFGQEQIPIPAIQAVTSGGQSGQADTIAGAAISDILAGANACAKLQRADQIISELGSGADAVKAAIGMVAAEKNFNPFTQSVPTICSDATLPKTAILRGITPLIDPAVGGSDVANALSNKTKSAPLDAAGLSVADLLVRNGFSNFTNQDAAGQTSAASSSTGVTAAGVSSSASADAAGSSGSTSSSGGETASSASASTPVPSSAAAGSNSSNSTTATKSSIAGLDFGLCVPTMKFEGGLDGRPANEFTFQIIDPLAAKGQQEALNPNIITNRICDQLTNVCAANDAAKTKCQAAKAQISALGTRDKSTADAWNAALGFAGAVTDPDGGPAQPTPSTASVAAKARFVREVGWAA